MEYVHPIVGYHLSYITLDPIQGCPYGCAYCLWKPYGLTTKKPSAPMCTPEELYNQLSSFLADYHFKELGPRDRSIIPFAIGNLTDMCATESNRRYLIKVLEVHSKLFPRQPLLIQTKSVLTKAFVATLDSFGVPIILAVSAVFFPVWRQFEPGTPSPMDRLVNFEKISETKNIKGIHYWRPVTSIDLDNTNNIREQVRLLKSSGSCASVLAGLMLGDKVAELLDSDLTNPLHEYYQLYHTQAVKQMLMPEHFRAVLEIAHLEQYPIYYRQTSCAISYALNQPDYFSSFRKPYRERCESSYCSPSQRSICSAFMNKHSHPTIEVLAKIATWLGITPDRVIYDEEMESIFVDTTLPQHVQNFLSHATGYLVRANLVISNSQWSGTHVPLNSKVELQVVEAPQSDKWPKF